MTPAPYERIAIVTGATSGIGEAVARAFVGRKFAVIGNARNPEKLAALERDLGDSFAGVAADASDPVTPELLFAEAERRFGNPPDLVLGRRVTSRHATKKCCAGASDRRSGSESLRMLARPRGAGIDRVQETDRSPDREADARAAGSEIRANPCEF